MSYVIQFWNVAKGRSYEIHGCTKDHVANDKKVREKVVCYEQLHDAECRTYPVTNKASGTRIPLLIVAPITSGWPEKGIHVLYQPEGKHPLPAMVLRSVDCEA